MATAESLATAGLRVTVLERGDLAAQASKACNAALLLQTKQPGPHLQLGRRALPLYRDLSARLDADVGFRPHPGLSVGGENARQEMAEQAEQLRSCGVPVQFHEGDLRHLEEWLSPHLACGLSCPEEAQVDPWRLCLALAQTLVRAGAQLRLGEPATALLARGTRVIGVRTPNGELHAGHTVVAAGLGCPDLLAPLQVHLPVTPVRGQVLVTEPLEPALHHTVLASSYAASKWASEQDSEHISLAVEQTVDGNLLIGGTRETGKAQPDTSIPHLRAIARSVQQHLPRLAAVKVIRCFAGLRPTSPDGLPWIGPVAGWQGLLVACGHGGDGISLALPTAELIRDYLTAQPTAAAAAFAPSRTLPPQLPRA